MILPGGNYGFRAKGAPSVVVGKALQGCGALYLLFDGYLVGTFHGVLERHFNSQ